MPREWEDKRSLLSCPSAGAQGAYAGSSPLVLPPICSSVQRTRSCQLLVLPGAGADELGKGFPGSGARQTGPSWQCQTGALEAGAESTAWWHLPAHRQNEGKNNRLLQSMTKNRLCHSKRDRTKKMQRKMILSFSIFCPVIPLVDSSKKEILQKEKKKTHQPQPSPTTFVRIIYTHRKSKSVKDTKQGKSR